MANKKFTEEEMNHLRASPYVLDVSPSIVHFSAKFKELFWKSILEGKQLWKIVIELGIDSGYSWRISHKWIEDYDPK